ncbi:MAG: ABC transporter ATP-binding protein, partial [Acidimicrobiales bacterium]
MWGGGGRGGPGNPGNGLPFAGIPPELQDGVDYLLKKEPEHGEPPAKFSSKMTEVDRRPVSIRHMIGQHWGLGVLAVFFVSVVSLANQAGPLLIGDGTNVLVHGLELHQPSSGVWGKIVLYSILYLVAIGVSAAFQTSQVRTTGRLAARVMNDLRVKVFAHLQRMSLDFYTDEKAGVIMTRMTSDIENLQQLLQDGLAQFVLQGLTMSVITVILFILNFELALITVLAIIPVLTIMSLWFRVASEKGYQRVRDGIAFVLADLSESLHGVRVVTAHNRQRHNVLHHRNVVGAYRDANNYTAQINAIYGPSTQMLSFLGQVVLLGVGGTMVLRGSLSLGALLSFVLYVNRFLQPITLLVQQYNTFQQGNASILKLNTLLTQTPNVPEDDDAAVLPPIEGDIRFENVTFGYDPATPVLHGVDLEIRPGETVAFVGPTGAGKSTMAK